MTKLIPFHYFKTSPEIIRLAVMLYVHFPLSLRNVEDSLLGCNGVEDEFHLAKTAQNLPKLAKLIPAPQKPQYA